MEDLQWLVRENEELTNLNRKLVNELEIYRYKDNLKEQEYILNHQYNETLIPHKYKYIFQSKYNYLKSQKDAN